jgi:hypothetical protein
MRPAGHVALLALVALAAACQHVTTRDGAPLEAAQIPGDAAEPSASAAAAGEAPLPSPKPDPDLLPPPPAPGQVPHIYMALQDGGEGRPVSVIFTIDAARNGTPSDDPAMRLTPENGLCNPQEMTRYDFPPDAATPAVGDAEQAEGLTARDLPAFMAIAVTNELLDRGIATDPEQTRPLNICTRKLWEQLVVAGNSATAAGQ